MADRYWVGGDGNWSQANLHWSDTSGGSPSSSFLPTSADNVIFDANSNTGRRECGRYLMPIDPQAYTVRPVEIQNPLATLGQIAQLRGMQTEQLLRQQQLR